jgi:5'-3' exonuclease
VTLGDNPFPAQQTPRMKPKRLHIVDGTYELFRAHYSQRPPHRTPHGVEAKATVGVVQSLVGLLMDKAEAVTHLAVAFDHPIRSFRNDLFAGYKTDAGVPQELLSQFDMVEQAVEALGVVVWSMDPWEADDAMATGAARFRDQVEQVRLMTPDKDLCQCVMGSRVVQVDRLRARVFDEQGVIARLGVPPQSVPDYLALMGDPADGIPGLPGFGARTAAALISRHLHLEHIPLRAAEWDVSVRGASRLASTWAHMQEEAKLYRTLATLVCNVPLKEALPDLRWCGVPAERFSEWCSALGVDGAMGRSLPRQ